jgi:hypothetical protein
MIKKINDHLNVTESQLEQLGVFNAFVDIDTKLFVDPILLKNIDIPEFKDSYTKLENYFEIIIRLLKQSKETHDLFWNEAYKRLIFEEKKGIAIGLGKNSGDGSGVGPGLASDLTKRAAQLVSAGIDDPELFELLGLFSENFGPDRLSDMTVGIICDDLYSYTERVSDSLNIKCTMKEKIGNKTFLLPLHPKGEKPIIFLPKALLRPLPVAKSHDDIDSIIKFNNELRERFNEIIRTAWRNTRGKSKAQRENIYLKMFFQDPNNISLFIKEYKKYDAEPYDFATDIKGQWLWEKYGRDFAQKHPLDLSLKDNPTINDIEKIVVSIISQFKKNIELNGLNELLFADGKKGMKPKNERHAQLLFYALSDAYCEANNISLNREPNPGVGSIDFIYGHGYKIKFIVEMKLSKSSKLIDGYSLQLPKYMEAENAQKGLYLVIQVSQDSSKINELKRVVSDEKSKNNLAPDLYIVDGRIKPTASHLKLVS